MLNAHLVKPSYAAKAFGGCAFPDSQLHRTRTANNITAVISAAFARNTAVIVNIGMVAAVFRMNTNGIRYMTIADRSLIDAGNTAQVPVAFDPSIAENNVLYDAKSGISLPDVTEQALYAVCGIIGHAVDTDAADGVPLSVITAHKGIALCADWGMIVFRTGCVVPGSRMLKNDILGLLKTHTVRYTAAVIHINSQCVQRFRTVYNVIRSLFVGPGGKLVSADFFCAGCDCEAPGGQEAQYQSQGQQRRPETAHLVLD